MREIFITIKEYFILLLGNIILLLGTGLFTYGFFNFSSNYHCASGLRDVSEIRLTYPDTYPVSISTFYYYTDTNLKLLTIGVIFIVIGLLKMRIKKSEN